jgi:hypothetical protein
MAKGIYSDDSIGSIDYLQNLGLQMYWAPDLVNKERVEEIIKLIHQARFDTKLPVPAPGLTSMRGGDGWDHGNSVTTNFFLIEGLYSLGYPDEANRLLFKMMDACMIYINNQKVPAAPEFWNERGEPWGCVDYSWNGLMTKLLIEDVCGINADVPNNKILFKPNLPESMESVNMVLPFGDKWIKYNYNKSNKGRLYERLAISNNSFESTICFRIPMGRSVQTITLDGKKVLPKITGNYLELVTKNNSFVIQVNYN